MSYWTLVTTRNRCQELWQTLESILNQELPCIRIIVFDDGSSDGTEALLGSYRQEDRQSLQVLRRDDVGYDIKRVVRNWNQCLAEAERQGLDRAVDFTLITADDCIYPPSYVRTIIQRMDREPPLAIASGSRGIPAPLDGWKPPEGSGRLIRNSFLRSVGFRFPEKSGYESWIVYEAMRRGFKVECINEVTYRHLERFGRSHGFVEWGYMPHALGYYPMFFLARVMQNLLSGAVPRRVLLRMVKSYLSAYFVKPRDPFYSPHSPELRSYVRSFQVDRMRKGILRSAMRFLPKA